MPPNCPGSSFGPAIFRIHSAIKLSKTLLRNLVREINLRSWEFFVTDDILERDFLCDMGGSNPQYDPMTQKSDNPPNDKG